MDCNGFTLVLGSLKLVGVSSFGYLPSLVLAQDGFGLGQDTGLSLELTIMTSSLDSHECLSSLHLWALL